MRMVYLIFGILIAMFLVNGRSFWWADPEYYKSKKLGEKYGGYYIFDKQFADEIKQRERERKEFDKKILDMSATDEEFRLNSKKYDVDKKLPRTLSNGKEYYLDSIDYSRRMNLKKMPARDVKISSKERIKLQQFMGEDIYKEFSVSGGSFYIDDRDEFVFIDLDLSIDYIRTTYGFYGDEGGGFKFSTQDILTIGSENIKYLIDGKFIKSDKKYFEEYRK